MKKVFLVLTLFSSCFAFSQEKANIHNVPYIEVTGEGKVEVSPNEVYLSIFINEEDRGKSSMEKLERDMLSKLEGLGVDVEKQVKVLNFNSGFRNRVLGQKINTSKRYELMLKETKRVPAVFVELEKLGISNIYVSRVDHSGREKLELDVKVAAVRSAKEKAVRMLEELGKTVGDPLYIQERNNGYYPQNDVAMRGASNFSVQEESAPDLDFRTITLRYSVQVRFSIDN
ncbi:MAG: SIMPL domain-containing protein [Cyclobacteriaceae bacterium]